MESQLVLDIRAHMINHPDDNAFDVYRLLRNADRHVNLLQVRNAWQKATLRRA